MSENLKRNWKTTVCGIAMLLSVVCGMILVPILDGNPDTNVTSWELIFNKVSESLLLIGIAVPTGLGFIFAKDGDK